MALSQRYVERIFARMLVRYGSAWLRMWEGIPMEEVQADWAEELSGFEASPAALKFSLENLPAEKPPTVTQFKAMCLKAPQYAPKALPAPAPDPAVVAAVMGAIKLPPARSPKFWAHQLRAREKNGAKLTITQKTMWREALKYELEREGATA